MHSSYKPLWVTLPMVSSGLLLWAYMHEFWASQPGGHWQIAVLVIAFTLFAGFYGLSVLLDPDRSRWQIAWGGCCAGVVVFNPTLVQAAAALVLFLAGALGRYRARQEMAYAHRRNFYLPLRGALAPLCTATAVITAVAWFQLAPNSRIDMARSLPEPVFVTAVITAEHLAGVRYPGFDPQARFGEYVITQVARSRGITPESIGEPERSLLITLARHEFQREYGVMVNAEDRLGDVVTQGRLAPATEKLSLLSTASPDPWPVMTTLALFMLLRLLMFPWRVLIGLGIALTLNTLLKAEVLQLRTLQQTSEYPAFRS